MTETVLDKIEECIDVALEFNENAHVGPVALLWPDEGRQWEKVVDRLVERRPVYSLGPFDPEAGTGPAYWVRCMVAGTMKDGPPSRAPLVYLPGVPRSELRAADSCAPEIAPIAELQYRSEWFSHKNGRDWTIRGLLANKDRGLGLAVAEDSETLEMLKAAMPVLLDYRVDRLTTQFLDADFFRGLVNPDPVRSLLDWLDDPAGFRSRLDDARWRAFVQQCQADYGLDPGTHGELEGARLLGQREGAWAAVWLRFMETPERYPGIPDRLRQAKPMELFTEHRDAWPQDNDAGETQLRSLLLDFESLTAEGARAEAARLEGEHGWRRGTVWAQLGRAPLAFAVEQIALLAQLTATPLGGDLESIANAYADNGWRADDAVVRALAAAPASPDRAAVSAALRAVYLPWVDAAARAMQEAVGPMANAQTYVATPSPEPSPGAVMAFVDGLRMDVAHRLRERLQAVGLVVEVTPALAALPTVTPTAKPAVAPVMAGALAAGPEFSAANAETGTRSSIQMIRSLIAARDVEVVPSTEVGDPSRPGWTEIGEIDHRGHDAGVRLADYLDDDVERIAVRLRELIEGGWQRVDVLTDHGWLLIPGGMPKVDLSAAVAEKKKGRCARLKDGAEVSVPTVPWYWDEKVRMAVAPGAACFEANKEYEHGGISPQECVVPRLSVTLGASTTKSGGPEITKLKWLGLLCRVEFTGADQAVVADLRALPADPNTSIAEETKETSSSGKLSLLVPDEEHEGEKAHLVLVDRAGQILAQREVVVGRNR